MTAKQPRDPSLKDFNVPGVVHAADYDKGRVGIATKMSVANYHVSTGNFVLEQRWAYRNDGVDIEPCNDNVNSNGFNVGWTAQEERLNYTVEVGTAGLYDIECVWPPKTGEVPSI